MIANKHHRYINYLLAEKKLLVSAYACTVIGVLFTVAMPWPVKYLIDDVLQGENQLTLLLGFTPVQKTIGLAIAIAVIAVAAACALALDKVLHARVREQFGMRLRDDLIQHVYRINRDKRHAERSGELNMRIVSDSQQASRLWCKTLPVALKHIGTAGFVLAITFTLNISIGLIALATTAVLSLVIIYYGPKLKKSAERKRTLEGEVSALTQETIKGIEHIQAMSLEQRARQKYIVQAKESLNAGVEEVRVAVGLERISQIISGVGLALVAGSGGIMVVNGQLSLGTLTVCLSYMTQLMKPIEKINEIASTISRSLTRLDRIEKLFEIGAGSNEIDEGEVLPSVDEIRAEKITYKFDDNLTPTVNNLSFCFRRGECIAITGPSGSGKSTLIRIILGLTEITDGGLYANGYNYSKLNLSALRSNFAVLMQDAHLFSGSFRQVLTEFNPNVSEDRIRQVLFELRLLEMIDQLPDGLDHPIDESGDRISGGQRARLLMGRALLSERPVLLFDEPLANIDDASKKIIRERLETAKKNTILIVVTHEYGLTEIADQVLDARTWCDSETPKANHIEVL